jgi:hypothetical protein
MGQRKKRVGDTGQLPLEQAKREYPIELQTRDLNVFKFCLLLVLATIAQIERMFFPGNRNGCNARLLKLSANKYLRRWKINLHNLGITDGPKETFLYGLDTAGAETLAHYLGAPVEEIGWQGRGKQLGEHDLLHLILNNDVRVAIKLAAEQRGYTVTDWETDFIRRRLADEDKFVVTYLPPYEDASVLETSEIIPDDSFTVVTPERRYPSFVELDTGSEPRQLQKRPQGKDTSIATKVRRYIELLHKPSRKEPSLYEKITGRDQKGIRVFFISTGTDKAVENLLSTIRNNNGRNTYWVARYELAKREDLILTRPIWRKAGDDEPIYYPWIGMSKLEQVRHRLRQYGVVAGDIEARVTAIINLAKSQVLEGWNERKLDMSVEQAVALRGDELAEAILKKVRREMQQQKFG